MSIPTLAITFRPSPACLWRVTLIVLLAFSGISEESVAAPGLQVAPSTKRTASTKLVTCIGKAFWYGPGFSGKKTASGDRFDPHRLTAAHRHLPLGTKAMVINLKNGKKVRVTINDRGPEEKGCSIGLSRAAAQRLGIEQDGVAWVRIEARPDRRAATSIGRATSTKPVNDIGRASWYGPGFHGKETASGERFNQYHLTAAHRHLPLGTKAVVINLKNGKKVRVTINDRGPSVKRRSIDLSRAAARRLGMEQAGVAWVRIEARPQRR
jgi:rare lipoprotein A (peptidoglycan hydrolase)